MMKNKLICLLIFTLLFNVSCSNKKTLLIGENYVLNHLENDDNAFLFNKITFQKLDSLLENNAISLSSKKSIVDSIKKANNIILSCGIYDVILLFDFSSSKLKYNEERIDQKLELIDYYIYNSFQIIDENINGKEVFVLEQVNPLITNFINIEKFEETIQKVNALLSSYSYDFGFNFIDLENEKIYVSEDFNLSETSKEYLLSEIYGKL